MRKARGQLDDVEAAVEIALDRGRTGIDDVAQLLFVSKSTLQRRAEPLTFTAVRQRVQLRLALKALTSGGDVGGVARDVALSRDHLRVLVKKATGLTPARIVQAAHIAGRIDVWKGQLPPQSGTWAYRRWIDQWDKADRKLQDLLGDIGPRNPLAQWAKRILVAAERPDNRLRSNRERIQDVRRREREREEEFWAQEEERFREFFGEGSSDANFGLSPLSEAAP